MADVAAALAALIKDRAALRAIEAEAPPAAGGGGGGGGGGAASCACAIC